MGREELIKAIELQRKQMIENASLLGISHQTTITYSQELDRLLNQLELTKVKELYSRGY